MCVGSHAGRSVNVFMGSHAGMSVNVFMDSHAGRSVDVFLSYTGLPRVQELDV